MAKYDRAYIAFFIIVVISFILISGAILHYNFYKITDFTRNGISFESIFIVIIFIFSSASLSVATSLLIMVVALEMLYLIKIGPGIRRRLTIRRRNGFFCIYDDNSGNLVARFSSQKELDEFISKSKPSIMSIFG